MLDGTDSPCERAGTDRGAPGQSHGRNDGVKGCSAGAALGTRMVEGRSEPLG